MKKSQLRNIIKESIKELMNEQTAPGPPPQGWPTGPNWQTLWQQWGNQAPPSPSQAFINRMTNLTCSGKMARFNHLDNKVNQLSLGINPNTGAQSPNTDPNYGSNPLWQGVIVSKLIWLMNDIQANNC